MSKNEREVDVEMPPASDDDPAAFGRSRARLQNAVASAPFAGRIGGNQEFIADPDDEESQELLKKQPDAVGSPMTSSRSSG